MGNKKLASQINQKFDSLADDMRRLHSKLCETNPLGAEFVLVQLFAHNETRNKMERVRTLLDEDE